MLLCSIVSSTSTAYATVTIDSIVIISNPTCGLDNGIVQVFAQGTGLSYSLDQGATTQDSPIFRDLSPMDLLVTVLSSDGCSETGTATLLNDSAPALPNLSCPTDRLDLDCTSADVLGDIRQWIQGIQALDFQDSILPVTSVIPLNDLVLSSCGIESPLELVAIDTCMGMSFCTATISLIDNDPPTANCPPALDVNTGNEDHIDEIEDWTLTVSTADACGDTNSDTDLDFSRINFICDTFFIIPVEFIVIDDCGNETPCLSQLNVTTEFMPIVSCTADLVVSCDLDAEEIQDELLIQFEEINSFDEDVTVDPNSIDMTLFDDIQCGDLIDLDFIVVDGCGRIANCNSQISVFDDEAPALACPLDLAIDVVGMDTREEIEIWLAQLSAEDNCSVVDFSSDLDTTLLDNLCQWPDTISINFIASDRCGNPSSCTSSLFVRAQPITLTCPSTDLPLECGDPENGNNLDVWLNSASAIDADGNTTTPVNDLDPAILSMDCGMDIPVEFSVTDACGSDQTCTVRLVITDNTDPTLDCPDPADLLVESEEDLVAQVQSWMATATSSDMCTMTTIESDFSITGFTCTLDTMVTFIATDECQNMSSCSQQLSIRNNLSLVINCPSTMALFCGGSTLDSEIESLISSVEILGSEEVTLTNDFDPDAIDRDCSESQLLSINIAAIDQCSNLAECTVELDLIADALLYIPTIFSTTGDGADNCFKIFSNGAIAMVDRAAIYDRWGNLVVEVSGAMTDGELTIWDGRINGQLAEQGVYTYHVVYSDTFGQQETKAGPLTLLR